MASTDASVAAPPRQVVKIQYLHPHLGHAIAYTCGRACYGFSSGGESVSKCDPEPCTKQSSTSYRRLFSTKCSLHTFYFPSYLKAVKMRVCMQTAVIAALAVLSVVYAITPEYVVIIPQKFAGEESHLPWVAGGCLVHPREVTYLQTPQA